MSLSGPWLRSGFARFRRRSGRRVLVLYGALLVAGLVFGLQSSRSAVTDRLDWKTWSSTSQTAGLECPSSRQDFAVVPSSVPQGSADAAEFHLDSSSGLWSNGIPRCMAAIYNSGETTGDNFYYGLSVYMPAVISDNLIWELHQPRSLYALAGCGVAPLALTMHGGRMTFRIATGNCIIGGGWSYWKPNIPIPNLRRPPAGKWIDFVIHIKFAEDRTGVVEFWDRIQGNPWPTKPIVSRYGIPTMPYCSSCGIHNVSLYTEMGLYPGYPGYTGNDTIYLGDFLRGASFSAVAGSSTTTSATTGLTPSTAAQRS